MTSSWRRDLRVAALRGGLAFALGLAWGALELSAGARPAHVVAALSSAACVGLTFALLAVIELRRLRGLVPSGTFLRAWLVAALAVPLVAVQYVYVLETVAAGTPLAGVQAAGELVLGWTENAPGLALAVLALTWPFALAASPHVFGASPASELLTTCALCLAVLVFPLSCHAWVVYVVVRGLAIGADRLDTALARLELGGEARVLLRRVESGRLAQRDLYLLGHLGHTPALLAVGAAPSEEVPVLADWLLGLPPRSQAPARAAAVVAAWLVGAAPDAWPEGQAVAAALEAWVAAGGSDDAAAAVRAARSRVTRSGARRGSAALAAAAGVLDDPNPCQAVAHAAAQAAAVTRDPDGLRDAIRQALVEWILAPRPGEPPAARAA